MTAARPTTRGQSLCIQCFQQELQCFSFLSTSHFQCVLQEYIFSTTCEWVCCVSQCQDVVANPPIEQIHKRSVLLVFERDACAATGLPKAASALKSNTISRSWREKLLSRTQFCTTRHYYGSTTDMTIMYLKSWKLFRFFNVFERNLFCSPRRIFDHKTVKNNN